MSTLPQTPYVVQKQFSKAACFAAHATAVGLGDDCRLGAGDGAVVVVGENDGAAVVGAAVVGENVGAGEVVGASVAITQPSQSRSAWQLSSGRQSGQHVAGQLAMVPGSELQ